MRKIVFVGALFGTDCSIGFVLIQKLVIPFRNNSYSHTEVYGVLSASPWS